MIRVFYADNSTVIDSIESSFVAGTLAASISGNGIVTIARKGDSYPFLWSPWREVGPRDGPAFDDPDSLMAYLDVQLSMMRPVGAPLRSYAVIVAARGQTDFPVFPSPADINTLSFVVNGIAYFPPASLSYDPGGGVATWSGPFDLIPADEVVLRYT